MKPKTKKPTRSGFSGSAQETSDGRTAWRLFIGWIPDAATAAGLEDLQRLLRAEISRFPGREAALIWTPPAQFHLTVEFLGNVDPARVAELSAVLDQSAAEFEPMELVFGELGCFPVFRDPRVLWTGGRVPEALPALRKCLRERLKEMVPVDSVDSFFPHITLARLKARSGMDGNLLRGVMEKLRRAPETCTRPGSVRALTLLRTVQTSSGVRHQALSTAKLGRNPDQKIEDTPSSALQT